MYASKQRSGIIAVYLSLGLAACSGELAHDSPFDPNAPLAIQAKGEIRGIALLAGETDSSRIVVRVSGATFMLEGETLEDGSYRIAPVTPGPVTITYSFRGFTSTERSAVIDLGGTYTAESLTLEPKTISVSGSALAELQNAGGTTTQGGVFLTLTRTGGVRDALDAAGAPAFLPAYVANAGVQVYTSVSSPGGDYSVDVSAGVYQMVAESEGAPDIEQEIEVTGEEDVEIEPIVLRPLTGLMTLAGQYSTGPTTSAETTTNRNITVTLLGFNATEMRVAEGTSCAAAPKIPYAVSHELPLSAGDGIKTVCARFVEGDRETDDITAEIELDTLAPASAFVEVQGGAEAVADSLVKLTLGADDSGTGVDTYELADNAAFADSASGSFRSLTTFPIGSTQGLHVIYARFRDKAGNVSAAESVNVYLDSVAPYASAAPGITNLAGTTLGVTNLTSVYINSPVTDATTAFALEYQASESSSFYGAAWMAYTNPIAWTFSASTVDGGETRTVYVRYRDGAGNAFGPVSLSMTLDSIAPSSPSLAINSPAASLAGYTNQASVNLSLSASGAANMAVGDDPFLTGVAPVGMAGTQAYALPGTDGEKIVYGRFYDAAGNASTLASDSIILDRQAPVSAGLQLNGGGAYVTSGSTVLAALSAVDSQSGLASVALSNNGYFDAASDVAYDTNKVWTYGSPSVDGVKTVWARFRDRAGNYTNAVSTSVTRDSTKPTGTLSVADGSDYVANPFVTVKTTASADTAKIILSNDSAFAVKTEYAYSANLVWALSAVATPQTVYAKFVDAAGNESNVYSDAVTYDAAAPVVNSFALAQTQGTVSLGLSWQAVPFSGVLGYRWYRASDGVVTFGGFTAGTSVTVPSPLQGETYAVSVTYTDGRESALSSPADEHPSAPPVRGILLVDDDESTGAVEAGIEALLIAQGYAYDVIRPAAASSGPGVSDLAGYHLVIWAADGAEAALTPEDREALAAHLSAGGNVAFIGDNGAEDADVLDFLEEWSHAGRVAEGTVPVDFVYGTTGDAIGGGIEFEVGPAWPPAAVLDPISGSSASWLRGSTSLALRYPESGIAPYRLAWAGIPAGGFGSRRVAELKPADLNVASSGTAVVLGDDDSKPLALGFSIKYGNLITNTVWVGSNGVISFLGAIPDATPYYGFPQSGNDPKAVVAAAWTDLRPDVGGSVYTNNFGGGMEIVWNGVPTALYAGFVTAAIRIHDDSTIEVIGADVIVGPGDALIGGFQDELGSSYANAGFEARFAEVFYCSALCAFNPYAFAFRMFSEEVGEGSTLISRLVAWNTPPASVTKTVSRYFSVGSSVSDAYEMRISTDGVLDNEAWVSYQTAMPLAFDGSEGSKTAQAVFRDQAGNQTAVQTTVSILDTIAPRIANVTLADSTTGARGVTRSRNVTLHIEGSVTSADYMRVSTSALFTDTGWTAFVEDSTVTLSAGDGVKAVYVWVKDSTGNLSSPVAAAIVLDTGASDTSVVSDASANAAPVYVNASYTEAPEGALTYGGIPAGSTLNISNEIPQALVDLPFTFLFYGRSYSQIVVYRNGLIGFGYPKDPETAPQGNDISASAVFANNAVAAPFLAELTFRNDGQKVEVSSGTDWLTVRWVAEDARTQRPVAAAVRIEASGRIVFLYGAGNHKLDPVVGLSAGDGQNHIASVYNKAAFLGNALPMAFESNSGDVAELRLYYRFHYPAGPGAWVDSGSTTANILEAMAFYPPLGVGTYDLAARSTDFAGNEEALPDTADATIFFDDEAPDAPSNIAATTEDNAIYVDWDASPASDVHSYRVYYGLTSAFDGSDALEGDSPVTIKGALSAKLRAVAPGKRIYVTVTAVDRVGNESSKPSGADVVYPSPLRQIGYVPGVSALNPRLKGDDLFFAQEDAGGFVGTYKWYEVRRPSAPTVLGSLSPVYAQIDEMLVRDRKAQDYEYLYDISTRGSFLSPAVSSAPGYYKTPMTPSTTVFNSFVSGYLAYNPGAVNTALFNVNVMTAERNFLYAFTWGANFTSTLLTFSPTGIPAVSPSNVLAAPVASADLSSGYLATTYGFSGGGPEAISIYDTNANRANPVYVNQLVHDSVSEPDSLHWVGDRLMFDDDSGVWLADMSDLISPAVESSLAIQGFPQGLAVSGNLGVSARTLGVSIFEFGELLPPSIQQSMTPYAGTANAIHASGDYAYVSQNGGIDLYSLSNLGTGSTTFISRFSPLKAMALEAFSSYLYVVDEQGMLRVLDYADPAQPKLVWSDTVTPMWNSPTGMSAQVIESTLYLDDRTYDLTTPSRPKQILSYPMQSLGLLRASNSYLYGVKSIGSGPLGVQQYQIKIYAPVAGELNEVGTYGDIVSDVTDLAVDGDVLYVHEGNLANRLTILNVSDPSAPAFLHSRPVDLFIGGLVADRGFLYYTVNTVYENYQIQQLDLRTPTDPQLTYRFGGPSFLENGKTAIYGDHFLVASDYQLVSFSISPRVPVRESTLTTLAGATAVAVGERYGYYAVGSTIHQVERRAPALRLQLQGTGEVALVKDLNIVQMYDPPGTPAQAGRFDLTNASYDTVTELCAAIRATNRVGCVLAGWISPAAKSTDLLDTFSLRLENDDAAIVGRTAALRTPRIVTSKTIPNITSITALEYEDDRLFAGAQGGTKQGLYQVDPVSLSYTYHVANIGANKNVLALAMRDSVAYIGNANGIAAYNWTTRTLLREFTGYGNVSLISLAWNKMYFVYRSAGTSYLHRIDLLANSTNFAVSVSASLYSNTNAFFGIAYLGDGYSRVALLTDNLNPWVDPGSYIAVIEDLGASGALRQQLLLEDATGPAFLKRMNNRLFAGFSGKISIFDVSVPTGLPQVRRELSVVTSAGLAAAPTDVDVIGDWLIIAGGSAGGVQYGLK